MEPSKHYTFISLLFILRNMNSSFFNNMVVSVLVCENAVVVDYLLDHQM